ncbi:MAG: DEAD/DEAH box helicase [Betaproteobacteria bacterium]|nr:DEAD/DEAH box helicase [Betaproteobacteria bacterium]
MAAMKILDRLLGISPSKMPKKSAHEISRILDASGLSYIAKPFFINQCLLSPHDSGDQAGLASLLGQLLDDGYGVLVEERFHLPWADVYRLMQDGAYDHSLHLLELPPLGDLRPVLSSRGALGDADFAILVSGWVDATGAPAPSPQLTGPLVRHGTRQLLLKAPTWRLLDKVAAFYQRTSEQHNADYHRKIWGEMRVDAQAVHAPLSDFLQRTIVLTPDKLHLDLRRAGEGENKTVEVAPTFVDAPARWLEIFDRLPSVPERYEIPVGQELVHVVVPPEVRSVLGEVKRMPGRRVSGSRAEAFVRNPFAVLGEEAAMVIDVEDFEQTREAANLGFQRFIPTVRRSEDARIEQVGLLVEQISNDMLPNEEIIFTAPELLQRFVDKLAEQMTRDSQCCFWAGYELEILGDTPAHLEQLRQILDEWQAPLQLSVAEIFDLSRYSERVEGFGVEKNYFSPFIARKTDAEGWFPVNVLFGFEFTPKDGSPPIKVPMDVSRVGELSTLVEDAIKTGQYSVNIPGCPEPIATQDAQHLLATFQLALDKVKQGEFSPDENKKPQLIKRQHLVVKANIDRLDYEEGRSGLLQHNPDTPPDLPASLRPEMQLKVHQHVGLSWLQHLWRLSPAYCRGCVLADDMGLGKTIQLLSFVAHCLESNTELDPVLVVAPVALLENWNEEINKFFVDGAIPILTLYGSNLAEKRLPKHQMDQELVQQGITRLLKRDWLGDARVVLTTYETLRNLEFAFAAQRWSILICDEAQKIKNPNAMVTRAAKKQNVRFRVACTGTPVENTLTDLWCLFDFVQPGLLGSLNQFGRQYRKPIEAETEDEKQRIEELRAIIKPQLLRREKKDVARDLPKKLIDANCRTLPISTKQRSLYAQALVAFRQRVKEDDSAHLGLLQFLRRLCSDPMVEDAYAADRASVNEIVQHSPKMAWLLNVLRDIQIRQEKAIVFCEFRDIQRTLQRCIASTFNMHVDIINGETSSAADHASSRQKRIRAFQDKPGFGAIVLSPLAVGFGVNIQAANHVIHFTRTWNPAKEDQATDRAYRIGQSREVVVYYPVIVAADFVTFDQKLDQLLDWKRALSQDMLNGAGDLTIADFVDLQA